MRKLGLRCLINTLGKRNIIGKVLWFQFSVLMVLAFTTPAMGAGTPFWWDNPGSDPLWVQQIAGGTIQNTGPLSTTTIVIVDVSNLLVENNDKDVWMQVEWTVTSGTGGLQTGYTNTQIQWLYTPGECPASTDDPYPDPDGAGYMQRDGLFSAEWYDNGYEFSYTIIPQPACERIEVRFSLGPSDETISEIAYRIEIQTICYPEGGEPSSVELSSFTATASDGNITLNWRTEAELDNVGFAVYRSATIDGNYTKIGFVPSAEDSEMTNDYKLVDKDVEPGKAYFYYLEDIDLAGGKSNSEIIKVGIDPTGEGSKSEIIKRKVSIPKPVQPIPSNFVLLQNYPNPFNPETWVPYKLPAASPVTIRIYNTNGQLIRTLDLGNKNAGIYVTKDRAAYWDGKNSFGQKVVSGLYFYNLQAGKFRATRRMIILK